MGVLLGLSAVFFLLVSAVPIYMVALLPKKICVHRKRAARSADIEALRQLWGKDALSEQFKQAFYRLIVHDTNKLPDGVVILVCNPNIVVRRPL